MTDPPSYDHDLLSRLNALKKSSITLDADDPSLSISRTRPTPETDLASRLRSLRDGAEISSSSSPRINVSPRAPSKLRVAPKAVSPPPKIQPRAVEGDIRPYISNIESPDIMVPGIIDDNEVRSALDQAQRVLGRERQKGTQAPQKAQSQLGNIKIKNTPSTPPQEADTEPTDPAFSDSGDEAAQEQEAADIIAQLLADIELERASEPDPTDAQVEEMRTNMQAAAAAQNEQIFVLPGVPSTTPAPVTAPDLPRKKSLDFEADIAARMAALKGLGNSAGTDSLGLPSAPTSAVGKRSTAAAPERKMEEVLEDWCVICQANATVLCHECGDDDGMLYCARCWKEAHFGEGAGWEERGHEWTRYRRPT